MHNDGSIKTARTLGAKVLTLAVRNLGGALHGGNRYRNRDVQAAALSDVIARGAQILLLQEVTGAGSPFEVPPGWRVHQPYSKADRGGASVVVVAEDIDVDLAWRPRHPVLDAFGAYLDFGLLHDGGGDVALVSVHATGWRPEAWAATGSSAPCLRAAEAMALRCHPRLITPGFRRPPCGARR